MYRPEANLPESGGIHNLTHTVYNACCNCLQKISNKQYCVKLLMLQKLINLYVLLCRLCLTFAKFCVKDILSVLLCY